MDQKKKGSYDLSHGSIPPLVLRVALPTTLALLSASLFHVVDAFYLSQLGAEAGAAVGVTFAFQTLMQAIGYTYGTGGGSLLSCLLGKGERGSADGYASVSFYTSFLIGSAILVFGLLFYPRLLPLLGADAVVYPLAARYLRIFLWSAPAVCSSFTLSQLLRSEGCASLGMSCLIGANLINILLDPIMIFTLDLGISGAAFATLISQWLGFLALCLVYLTKQSKIRLFAGFPEDFFEKAREISIAGTPSFLRQGLICLATILLNHGAAAVGVAAVAAMSAVNRIFLLTYSFCAGIGQGMMSLIGYNYGAGEWGRVKQAFRFSLWLSTGSMLAVSIPIMIYAPEILSLFRKEAEVISFGSAALRAQMAVLAFHGVMTCCSMALQAVKKPLAASLVASGRQGLFFLPLMVFLPSYFGVASVRYVQPLSDAFSFLFTLPFWLYLVLLLRRRQRRERSAFL